MSCFFQAPRKGGTSKAIHSFLRTYYVLGTAYSTKSKTDTRGTEQYSPARPQEARRQRIGTCGRLFNDHSWVAWLLREASPSLSWRLGLCETLSCRTGSTGLALRVERQGLLGRAKRTSRILSLFGSVTTLMEPEVQGSEPDPSYLVLQSALPSLGPWNNW